MQYSGVHCGGHAAKLQLQSYIHTLITGKYKENNSHNYLAILNKIIVARNFATKGT